MRSSKVAAGCSLLVLFACCGRVGFDANAAEDLDAAIAAIDAGDRPIDAGADALVEDTSLNCARMGDSAAIAVFGFNADSAGQILDGAGSHDGTTVGTPDYVEGPSPACGMALRFPGTADYAVVADSSDWQLDKGSIDFWFRAEEIPADFSVMVGRDAGGTALPGHVTVAIDSGQGLAVRVQEQNAPNNNVGSVCSAGGAVAINAWNHVGVNFGPPGLELWHNGATVDEAGMVGIFECQTGTQLGLTGNVNPWVLGVGSTFSDPEAPTPTDHPFAGAIDHFRVSNTRRDFSGIAFQPVTP